MLKVTDLMKATGAVVLKGFDANKDDAEDFAERIFLAMVTAAAIDACVKQL